MEHTQGHIRRGDIYLADLRPAVGSEQDGVRPVLIIQNNTGNKYSPTVIAAAITSRQTKSRLPTHVRVGEVPGMLRNSVILLEQIRTIDKSRLLHKIFLPPKKLRKLFSLLFPLSHSQTVMKIIETERMSRAAV